MTSHVDQAVQARIAAVAARKQQQQEDREAFSRRRAEGLEARKRQKLRRIFCGSCARMQRKGTYRRCPLGCGEALCRKLPGCGNAHLRQCPNRGGTATVATPDGGAANPCGPEGHAGMGQQPTTTVETAAVEADSLSLSPVARKATTGEAA